MYVALTSYYNNKLGDLVLVFHSAINIFFNGSSQGRFGHRADDALFLLAVLEKQHGRNAPDPVLCGDVGAVVGVELVTS